LSTIGNSLHTRSADFINGGSGDVDGDLGSQSGLSGRVLAETSRADVTEDNFVDFVSDLFSVEASTVKSGINGNGTEFSGLNVGHLSEENTNGGSLGGNNDGAAGEVDSGSGESSKSLWKRGVR